MISFPGTSLFAPQVTTYAGNAPTARSRVHPDINVYIETKFESNDFVRSNRYRFRSIEEGIDGTDTLARIHAGLDVKDVNFSGLPGLLHLGDLRRNVLPDRRVRIAQGIGADGQIVYFQGYPLTNSVEWNDRGQLVSATCLSEGHEVLRRSQPSQITGRFMRANPLADNNVFNERLVSALPVVFNPDLLGNRLAAPIQFILPSGTFRIHVFTDDGASNGEKWTVVQALRYLVFFHIVKPGLSVDGVRFLKDSERLVDWTPTRTTRDPWFRRMTTFVDDVATTSTDVESGIVQLCDHAGLHYELPIGVTSAGDDDPKYYVRVYAERQNFSDRFHSTTLAETGKPTVHTVPREAPFQNFTGRTVQEVARGNAAVQSSLLTDWRGIGRPIYLAGQRLYEVTLLLRPGWSPFEFLDDFVDSNQQQTLDTDAKKQAAIDFWQKEFNPIFQDETRRKPRSRYHRDHPLHFQVGDVGRTWIFPDSMRYVNDDFTSPLARSAWPAKYYSPFDPDRPNRNVMSRPDIGGGVAQAISWVPRNRPFGDVIGRRADNSDTAPIVEISFNAYDPLTALQAADWHPYDGSVKFDMDRAAMTFEDGDLLGSRRLSSNPEIPLAGISMIEALIGKDFDDEGKPIFREPHFAVAVTCTVVGDSRLSYAPLPTFSSHSLQRFQTIDVGERFEYRNRRGQNSRLDVQELDQNPDYETKDDTSALEAFGNRERQLNQRSGVSGSIDIFWLETQYKIGDTFSGVESVGVNFVDYPSVVRREFLFDRQAGYRTVLHLTDLRDAPEVGDE